MRGPFIGTGWYSVGTGHYNTHRLPQEGGKSRDGENTYKLSQGRSKSSDEEFRNEEIATRVNQALGNYEEFLSGKKESEVPLSEAALLILGKYVAEYIPQEMGRYEQVLDRLSNETQINADWVRNLLYAGLEKKGSKEPKEGSHPLGVGALL